MTEIIRRIEERDFEFIASMYNNEKSVPELKWLFTDPDESNKYNAFVAIDETDNLIGVIGYSLAVYTDGIHKLSGVIPMSWKISSDYKGFAGIQLFKKVLSVGDFGIAIAGSDTAIQLYPLFKYRFFSPGYQYYKLLSFKNAFISLKRTNLLKTIGMIGYLSPSRIINFKKENNYPEIELIPYKAGDFHEDKNHPSLFRKVITENYINWLLNCPKVNAYAFCVKHGNEYLGNCVLYIKKVNNVNRGRIVHLPFLGPDQNLWSSVIQKCIAFFNTKRCCLVTALAHNNMNQAGLSKSGFMKIESHAKPIFIKDSNNKIDPIALQYWFLQYSEGDKAYRDL